MSFGLPYYAPPLLAAAFNLIRMAPFRCPTTSGRWFVSSDGGGNDVTARLANGIFLTATRKSLYWLPTLAARYSTRISRTPSTFGPSYLFYLFVETSRYVTTPNRSVTCTVTYSTVVTPLLPARNVCNSCPVVANDDHLHLDLLGNTYLTYLSLRSRWTTTRTSRSEMIVLYHLGVCASRLALCSPYAAFD
jgi:hypothetical protein